ncbi:hypothetical protein BVG19_g2275 [[Candida] boidinii]|nr:hypothetical protein BVG19_g2275 [[Candida] boidinii]OWB52079.1 hypothetical protein B5S27_g3651 [[Candida] boidinii]
MDGSNHQKRVPLKDSSKTFINLPQHSHSIHKSTNYNKDDDGDNSNNNITNNTINNSINQQYLNPLKKSSLLDQRAYNLSRLKTKNSKQTVMDLHIENSLEHQLHQNQNQHLLELQKLAQLQQQQQQQHEQQEQQHEQQQQIDDNKEQGTSNAEALYQQQIVLQQQQQQQNEINHTNHETNESNQNSKKEKQGRMIGEELRNWQKSWRAIMRSSIIYIEGDDGKNETDRLKIRLGLEALGATFERFFSEAVTIIVSKRPFNRNAEYGTGDIFKFAKKNELKVWNYEKVFRFLNHLGEPIPEIVEPTEKQKKLSTLLQDEKLYGPKDRDPNVKRDDIKYFQGLYYYLYDARQHTRPVAIREYSSKSESYPRLYKSTNGRSLFLEDNNSSDRERKHRKRLAYLEETKEYRQKLISASYIGDLDEYKDYNTRLSFKLRWEAQQNHQLLQNHTVPSLATATKKDVASNSQLNVSTVAEDSEMKQTHDEGDSIIAKDEDTTTADVSNTVNGDADDTTQSDSQSGVTVDSITANKTVKISPSDALPVGKTNVKNATASANETETSLREANNNLFDVDRVDNLTDSKPLTNAKLTKVLETTQMSHHSQKVLLLEHGLSVKMAAPSVPSLNRNNSNFRGLSNTKFENEYGEIQASGVIQNQSGSNNANAGNGLGPTVSNVLSRKVTDEKRKIINFGPVESSLAKRIKVHNDYPAEAENQKISPKITDTESNKKDTVDNFFNQDQRGVKRSYPDDDDKENEQTIFNKEVPPAPVFKHASLVNVSLTDSASLLKVKNQQQSQEKNENAVDNNDEITGDDIDGNEREASAELVKDPQTPVHQIGDKMLRSNTKAINNTLNSFSKNLDDIAHNQSVRHQLEAVVKGKRDKYTTEQLEQQKEKLLQQQRHQEEQQLHVQLQQQAAQQAQIYRQQQQQQQQQEQQQQQQQEQPQQQQQAAVVRKKARNAMKAGYCENCRVKYDDFDDHILISKHRQFATDDSNFSDIDRLIDEVNSARMMSL